MTKKTITAFVLSLMYILPIFLGVFMFSANLPYAGAELSSEYPTVFVDPQRIVAGVNETFTVSVKVHNLNNSDVRAGFLYIPLGNLYSFHLEFGWNPSILEYVSHTLKIPVEDYPDGVLNEPIVEGQTVDEVNEEGVTGAEPGTLYLCEAFSRDPAPPFNCKNRNATFFNMTFRVKKEGACKLDLKRVELASAGTEHCNPGMRIGWDPNRAQYTHRDVIPAVFSTSAERDVMVEAVSATSPAGEGCNVTVDATVANNGPFSENFTVAAYYNQSTVQVDNLFTTGNWMLIESLDVTGLEGGGKYDWCFQWNTSDVLGGKNKAQYYIKVNASKLDGEVNTQNNAKLSNAVLVTIEVFWDAVVNQLDTRGSMIRNETATLDIGVWYNGTTCKEAFNVTLYFEKPNQETVVSKRWTISLAGGHTWTETVTWDSTNWPEGEYTFVANVSTVEGEVDIDNNKMEQELSVILPPVLQIDVSPSWEYIPPTQQFSGEYKVKPEEDVKLNASDSYHPMAGAEITEYKWEIIDSNSTTIDTKYGKVIEHAFTSGIWVVRLTVKDSFNMTYNKLRHGTYGYQASVHISAEEQPAEGGSTLYLGIVVIAIIVIAGAAYLLLKRKK